MNRQISVRVPSLGVDLAFGDLALSSGIAAATGAVIVVASLASGVLYHLAVYGDMGDAWSHAGLGAVAALLFLTAMAYGDELSIDRWLGPRRRRLGHLGVRWLGAFATLMAIAFLTKTTADFSRGSVVLFFLTGLVSLTAFELGLTTLLRHLRDRRLLTARRVLVIGGGEAVAAFRRQMAGMPGAALDIVAALTFDTDVDLERQQDRVRVAAFLDAAVETARVNDVRDVVLLVDWSNDRLIDGCVEAFSLTPVAIHLDAGRFVSRFGEVKLERLDRLRTLALTAPPLNPLQAASKRLLDLVVAATALMVLASVLAAIALAVKLDSEGPVLFRQRRLGYNQRAFQILKFRTMTTLDDGDVVVQAKKGDKRITRVGAFLRRTSLDELPQLFNVLMGDMSVVGPRPHAIAHDRLFEKRIVRYPRRLNMRPGITGWAQVHGLRGETDTDDKMRRRVEHDLYYIDNWSLGLDVYILALTVFSPLTYKNAQ